jgi:hypothetical protein
MSEQIVGRETRPDRLVLIGGALLGPLVTEPIETHFIDQANAAATLPLQGWELTTVEGATVAVGALGGLAIGGLLVAGYRYLKNRNHDPVAEIIPISGVESDPAA